MRLILLVTVLAAATVPAEMGMRVQTLARLFLPRCRHEESIGRDDVRLRRQIVAADYVFAGKVADGEIQRMNDTIIFDVHVKRYFKRDATVPDFRQVRVQKRLYEGEGVRCRQSVRSRFTAIFVGRTPPAQPPPHADVVLTVNPVPLTLANLDRVSAAAGDVGRMPGENLGELHASKYREVRCFHVCYERSTKFGTTKCGPPFGPSKIIGIPETNSAYLSQSRALSLHWLISLLACILHYIMPKSISFCGKCSC